MAPTRHGVPGFGTGIGVEADTTVVGNMVDGAPLFGINAGWGEYLRDVVISVKRRPERPNGHRRLGGRPGAGTALVNGNVIGAREGAILAHAWGKPVGPDLVASAAEAPGNITLSGNSHAYEEDGRDPSAANVGRSLTYGVALSVPDRLAWQAAPMHRASPDRRRTRRISAAIIAVSVAGVEPSSHLMAIPSPFSGTAAV